MYIGLDIGTSGTKAALVDREGNILQSCQINYDFSNTKDGYRELDGDMVWEAVKKCLRHTGEGHAVKTITVSALGEAVIPVDKMGNPLCYSILGTDIRGKEELKWLIEAAGRDRLTEITGQNLSAIYSVNKILWLKTFRKEIFESAWKIVTFQDYIIYRLTNHAVIDYSMASRTLLFDTNRMEWSEELLVLTGIRRELLSDARPSGSRVGRISSDVARELLISGETEVIAGTHDHICNALGSGVHQDGWCSNVVGTTEGLTAILKKEELPTADVDRYQISRQPFAKENLYNTVAWNNTSGVLLRWFAQQFDKSPEGKELTEQFASLNEKMPDAPTDLFVLPHFSGAATPYMDVDSRGAVLGLTMDTKNEELYKALMEGANYELAFILECLRAAGVTVKTLVSSGGALSPKLLQIKADILGIPVLTVLNKQTGTLGGAILGAVAIGDYATIEEASARMVSFGQEYLPDQERHAVYAEKLQIYKKIYPAVKDINHRI
ncbi:MAG: FGGY-family carbohydrate kinase [Lachnospiraceae bacterium]